VEGRSRGEGDGRVETTRAFILRAGAARFGPAPSPVHRAMEEGADLPTLERWAARVLEAPDWPAVTEPEPAGPSSPVGQPRGPAGKGCERKPP
jgi:hypothetical protein